MAKRAVAPTRAATDALMVLGTQIRAARHDKNWTAAELGMRIGADPRTITAIERGAPGVSIGTVFSAASVLGVRLFGADDDEMARLRRRGEERIALIPTREYKPRSMESDADDALDF
ncbi:helix-turn-helix domain-containing protein [Mycobacteroides abscessus]|uniref:Transcriptional regulator, y4mF family n=1 Tax=Mycobacteroides abscessus TaxID=36809 RepID=A0A0U0ZVH2_9MYCO|nr:helix-turn-helix transcriptional regulator [Mycobacteroides abscessus]MBL3733019.1 helix-turn-helix transcriptional regulator [Mycobacteroides abscessus subsp. massiliense]MBL3745767.1 helix-turn-helix transcriptional regulator [Mycobacteroides abscessus subsp. massiliense]MBL3761214.1 helix-turn-helix transcriptional regulator [Mycobacteroides abscessus subsp. massiliense]MBN7483399.1 helix-turn-helix transcriptional regulator [Mycobacteroides abscessus subsp. massiliense]MDB2215434.1 heli